MNSFVAVNDGIPVVVAENELGKRVRNALLYSGGDEPAWDSLYWVDETGNLVKVEPNQNGSSFSRDDEGYTTGAHITYEINTLEGRWVSEFTIYVPYD